jgi:ABC-2 type transport system ATP-binding protein
MEIIQAEQVSKEFDGSFRLGPLDLRVAPGEILGIVGPVGAGKTTLLRLLWGFVRPDSGRISILGMQPHLNQMRVRRQVGYVTQNPSFHSECTAKQFLQFVGHFYDGWEETYASRLLSRLDIDPQEKIHKLPIGDRIKVGIVAAASHQPALLLLDEPKSDVDLLARLDILHFLRRLAREERVSILVSFRMPDDLDYIADSVLMLKDGRAIEYASSTNNPEENRLKKPSIS